MQDHPLLARATEAIELLADRGADVRPIQLRVTPEAIRLSRDRRTLILLPAAPDAAPSMARILAEAVTFLLPVPEDALQRIAHDLRDAGASFLDPVVDISQIDPTIVIDSRYATADNCARRALYPPSMRRRCFLRQSAAQQLRQAHAALASQGYGLTLWDGYRPQAVQRQCVDPNIIPDAATRALFVPPAQGSNHGRGCAVDVTLVYRDTGRECAMPTGFDSPSPSAAWDATEGLAREQIDNRQRLQAAMTQAGFAVLPHEWWHFNWRPDGRMDQSRNAGDLYLVLDTPFEALLS